MAHNAGRIAAPLPTTSSQHDRAYAVPSTPAAFCPRAGDAPRPLLSDAECTNEDESYGDDERALSSFLKLHPMLSCEAKNQNTLQLMADMFERAQLRTHEVEIVPKSYDDQSLRPPNLALGERACACGEQCICRTMAYLRYGNDSPYAFTCTEFLLPSERAVFSSGGELPARRKKCLVCARYFQVRHRI